MSDVNLILAALAGLVLTAGAILRDTRSRVVLLRSAAGDWPAVEPRP